MPADINELNTQLNEMLREKRKIEAEAYQLRKHIAEEHINKSKEFVGRCFKSKSNFYVKVIAPAEPKFNDYGDLIDIASTRMKCVGVYADATSIKGVYEDEISYLNFTEDKARFKVVYDEITEEEFLSVFNEVVKRALTPVPVILNDF